MSMFNLRPYQNDCIESVMADLVAHSRLGVVLPTGTGKTEIMLAIADRFITENESKVLMLSHMGILVDQTGERVERRFPHIQVGYCRADQLPSRFDQLIIGTMQSAKSETKLFQVADHIGLIIVDEAHMIQTPTYHSILKRYSDAKVIGFTATPFRDRRLMTDFFEKVSYTASLETMQSEGYLVHPRIIGMQTRKDTAHGIIADVAALIDEHERNSQSIVYLDNKLSCGLLRNALNEMGIPAAAITSDTPREAREDYFTGFRAGEVKVLVSVNVLTAGFDSPNVNCIIMPHRTASPTVYIQRVGRGLRPYPGKEECRIYVFGKAPKVEEAFYRDLQSQALTGRKKESEPQEFEDFEPTEVITWGLEYLKIKKELEANGHRWAAQALVSQNIPPILTQKIKELHEYVLGKEPPKNVAPASDKQKWYLQQLGVTGLPMHKLTMGEANDLIWVIKAKHTDEFAIRSGSHEGKHVKDLPWSYKKIVLKQYGNSHIAQLIRRWDQRVKNFKEKQV